MATLALAAVALACRPNAECGGYCGAGTQCEAERCVPAEPVTEDTPSQTDPEPGKKKRRRKGRRRKGAGRSEGDLPPAAKVDDSRVPRYNPKRLQQIGMSDGTQRLSDFAVKNHMKRLESKFNGCIERAALATDQEIRGTVSFTIGVEPSGKVWGVSVKAPGVMKKTGVVACLRVVVHKSRFPTWDGPSMGVDYAFEVG